MREYALGRFSVVERAIKCIIIGRSSEKGGLLLSKNYRATTVRKRLFILIPPGFRYGYPGNEAQ